MAQPRSRAAAASLRYCSKLGGFSQRTRVRRRRSSSSGRLRRPAMQRPAAPTSSGRREPMATLMWAMAGVEAAITRMCASSVTCHRVIRMLWVVLRRSSSGWIRSA
ncbi:hypothetical protein D3C84_1067130 [compost metagenome]